VNLTLRHITDADLEFLWQLHNAALREFVEKTWGWDEEWQRSRFENEFDPAKGKIVVIDGDDAGFWWVVEHENEVVLASVRLLPEFQNRGIGTRLINVLIHGSEKPIRLKVLKVNPALNLYERFGFKMVETNETHYTMVLDR
jgi:ribosomal protein S18 acetylase RimI-like enzyme